MLTSNPPLITKSFGYLFLIGIKEKINNKEFPQIGSIIKMNNVINNIFFKITLFQVAGSNKNSAYKLSSYCLDIRENTLPTIMNNKIWTPESKEVYTAIFNSCSYLLDDLQTWY